MTPGRLTRALLIGDVAGVEEALAQGLALPSDALQRTAMTGHLSVVRLLWEGSIFQEHKEAFLAATSHGHSDVMGWMLGQSPISSIDDATRWQAYGRTLVNDFVQIDAEGNPISAAQGLAECRQRLQDAGVQPADAVAWMLLDKGWHHKIWKGWDVLPVHDFPTPLIDQVYRAYMDYQSEFTSNSVFQRFPMTAPTLVMEWERRQLEDLVPQGAPPRPRSPRL